MSYDVVRKQPPWPGLLASGGDRPVFVDDVGYFVSLPNWAVTLGHAGRFRWTRRGPKLIREVSFAWGRRDRLTSGESTFREVRTFALEWPAALSVRVGVHVHVEVVTRLGRASKRRAWRLGGF